MDYVYMQLIFLVCVHNVVVLALNSLFVLEILQNTVSVTYHETQIQSFATSLSTTIPVSLRCHSQVVF